MLKAKVLNSKPDIKKGSKIKEEKVSIIEINRAIESLGLKYKPIDEVDIFNICSYILSNKKGS